MSRAGPIWFTRDLYLTEEFRRIGRYLLAERPEIAELFAIPNAQLGGVLDRDNVVMQFKRKGRAFDSGYIIKKGETHYTTAKRPKLPRNEKIVVFELPASTPTSLLRRLERVSNAIKRTSPQAYEMLRIGSRLESIRSLHPSYSTSEQTAEDVATSILLEMPSLSVNSAGLIERAQDFANEVISRFAKLEITGEAAERVLATFLFYSLHPSPPTLIQILNSLPGFQLEKQLRADRRTVVVPPMSIGFYLGHPTGGRASFIAAKAAGRVSRRKARENWRIARSSVSVVEFHWHLYLSLLYYRAAREVYAELQRKSVQRTFNTSCSSQDEFRKFWVEAEEGRATIIASLSSVAFPWRASWNSTRPNKFLDQLARLYSTKGFEHAQSVVGDLGVRLACPTIVRDIASAFLVLADNRQVGHSLKSIDAAIERLETELPRSVMAGDANYLHYAYEIGAALHWASGQEQISQTLLEKKRELPASVRELLKPYS